MLATTWNILTEAAPFLMLGFLVAGVMHVLLSRWSFARYLQGRGPGGVLLAALVGLPLPLCSCSVLPTALTLRKKGASPGSTLAFLVSTPETSVPSILLTYALLGPVMAVVRPIAACASAIAAGLAGNAVTRSTGDGEVGGRPAVVDAGACCACGEADGGVEGVTVPSDAVRTSWSSWGTRVRDALHFAFVRLFDDVFVWVLLGVVVAGAIRVFVPPETLLGLLGGPLQSMAVMVLVGVPLYVCAEASTPVAAVLIAQGVSPGAALVFLLVGPATNIGSLGVLGRALGRHVIVVYLAAVVGVAVVAGLLLDVLAPTVSLTHAVHGDHEMMPGGLSVVATVLFLALGAASIVRRRWVRRAASAAAERIHGVKPSRAA